MWLSFWIAVAIGMVAAIPIWSHPEFENVWIGVGALASAAQSGLLQVAFFPKTTNVRVCHGSPYPLCYDSPVQENVGMHFVEKWPEYISGMFIDIAAAVTSGALVIVVVLLFIGGEAAKKKRREIFW